MGALGGSAAAALLEHGHSRGGGGGPTERVQALGSAPTGRAQDAIAEIHHFTSESINYQWVLEADIAACFDEIDHVALMDRVRVRTKDKRLCNLVKAFLKAGVFDDLGDREESLTGTPQAPLLANIALSALDEHFTRQWNTETGVMGTGSRRAKRKRHIRRKRKRGTNKHYVYTHPARKSIQKVRDRVRDKTYRSTRNSDLDELLASLNRSLRGWANYFRHGVSKATFNAVDHHAWWRLDGWIRRKHKISRKQLRHRFCIPGSWRIAHNGVVFTGASSVAVTRYRYRGANILTPWTPATARHVESRMR